MSVERVEKLRECSGEPVGVVQAFTVAFERPLANHGAPVALRRRVVSGDQL
jgi:hypothetical protein